MSASPARTARSALSSWVPGQPNNEQPIAFVFGDQAVESRYRLRDPFVMGTDHGTQIVVIECCRERRRAHQVAEHDRELAALHDIDTRRYDRLVVSRAIAAPICAAGFAASWCRAIARKSWRRWPRDETAIPFKSWSVRSGKIAKLMSFPANRPVYRPRPSIASQIVMLPSRCSEHLLERGEQAVKLGAVQSNRLWLEGAHHGQTHPGVLLDTALQPRELERPYVGYALCRWPVRTRPPRPRHQILCSGARRRCSNSPTTSRSDEAWSASLLPSTA
jgi:hypothetical protein